MQYEFFSVPAEEGGTAAQTLNGFLRVNQVRTRAKAPRSPSTAESRWLKLDWRQPPLRLGVFAREKKIDAGVVRQDEGYVIWMNQRY